MKTDTPNPTPEMKDLTAAEWLASRGLADLSLYWPHPKPIPQKDYPATEPQPTLQSLMDEFAAELMRRLAPPPAQDVKAEVERFWERWATPQNEVARGGELVGIAQAFAAAFHAHAPEPARDVKAEARKFYQEWLQWPGNRVRSDVCSEIPNALTLDFAAAFHAHAPEPARDVKACPKCGGKTVVERHCDADNTCEWWEPFHAHMSRGGQAECPRSPDRQHEWNTVDTELLPKGYCCFCAIKKPAALTAKEDISK